MKKTVGWEAQSPVKKAVGSGGLTGGEVPSKKRVRIIYTYIFIYLLEFR